ncbi:MAG: M24 family metallopeptidase [Armatimonadetes bacterium]|nr:M24 family metallopeptidase [Armatimonadota bacterium]
MDLGIRDRVAMTAASIFGPHTRRRMQIAAAVCCLIVAAAGLLRAVGPPEPTLLGQARSEFADRRARLRETVGDAIVLLVTTPTYDDRARFRMVNEMVYLTGAEAPGSALALLPDDDPAKQPAVLFLPGRPSAEAEQERTGIPTVRESRGMWEFLEPSIRQAKTVYIVGPVGERGKHGPSGAVEERMRATNPKIEVRDLRTVTSAMRIRKSAGEIANLRAAISATIRGFQVAAPQIKPGMTELAVEGYILAGFRLGGASREGFPAVIGSGPNSLILHNDPTDRVLQRDETLVADIGAEVNYYTADLTRTFPVGGRFTPRRLALYELVREVQAACEKHIVPGKTTWSDLNSFAKQQFRKSTLRAEDRDGQMQTMDRFFVHGLGHWLGMDVHDVGGMAGPLPPNSVITIEPGLYIASENTGIRIEDDYLVTETGVERLSAALPSDAPSVQRMMRGR